MASSTPTPHRKPVPGTYRSTRGFALLITITLLAFLVLLLVSLASLTRVETQVAGNNQQLAQARQNALMALNLAIGQLQRQTGADQRVTARADMLTTYAGSPAATALSSDFDTFWKNRSRAWTGAWGNNAAANGYTLKPTEIVGSGTSSELLGWLVSGNEGGSFTLDTATGRTSGASVPRFTPDLQVSGLSATTDPSTSLTFPVANALAGTATTRGALLVGPGTTSDGSAAGKTASFNAGNYVVAPVVDIQVPATSVPGLGSAVTATTIGGYAYWVGDEGVKARVNLRGSYQKQTAAADQTAFQRYSFMASQRSAIEMLNYDPANRISTDYTFDTPAIDRIQALNQLGFSATNATSSAHLQLAKSTRFHDLTAVAQGVLADTYAGGLKKDLTADIANPSTAAAGTRPADTTPLFTPEKSTDTVPTWGLLRNFPRTNPTSNKISPRPPTPTDPGIYPVINFASLGLDFYLDFSNQIRVAMFPVVVLWNPHATTITQTDYEIGFHVTNTGNPARFTLETSTTAAGPFTTLATLDLKAGDLVPGTASGSADGFIRFRIRGEEIPPGETQIYRLGATSVYSPGTSMMVRGAGGLTNYVSWTIPALGGLSMAMLVDGHFRVQGLAPQANGHALDVVLAKPAGISTLTANSDWYQSVQDARMGVLGSPNLKASAPLATLPPASIGASSALAISAVMESRGGFNSQQNAIGALGSGRTRWLVTGNPRAPKIRNTSAENANNRGNTVFGANLIGDGGSTGRDLVFPYNGRTHDYRVGIGGSQDTNAGAYRPSILFDVLTAPDILLSLGQLQHASLATYGFQSAYSFGNAWADVRVPRNQQHVVNFYSPNFAATNTDTLYDLSWHLNRALWDKYFVSGIPSTWTAADVTAGRALPDARMTCYYRNGQPPSIDDLRFTGAASEAYDKAAANLLVEGAFNINSTSEQAWRALLASAYRIPDNPVYADTSDSVGDVAAVPRFIGNHSLPGYANAMCADAAYRGNRGLFVKALPGDPAPTASEVGDIAAELARTIVAEVRARGPFLSLSDFVNRRITAAGDETGIRGTLQAAIDKMAVNPVNPSGWLNAGLVPGDKPVGSWNVDHYVGGPSGTVGARPTACPKYMTQADLLSLLGPALSARSDTFCIRTYGEVKNPVTGDITGRAWCEATVQRLPDYVVPKSGATGDNAETARADLTSNTNKSFGRRFVVTGFRWLSPSDL